MGPSPESASQSVSEIGESPAVSGKALTAGIAMAGFRHTSPAGSALRLIISEHALRDRLPIRSKRFSATELNNDAREKDDKTG